MKGHFSYDDTMKKFTYVFLEIGMPHRPQTCHSSPTLDSQMPGAQV